MESSFNNIFKELKLKKLSPVYIFYGEETYYIDKLTDYIESNLLTESEKGFNQSVIYGGETSVNDLIGLLKRYPVMSKYHLVILKEAHRMNDIKELVSYLETPAPTSILVINYRKEKLFIDKRIKAFKKIQTNAVIYNSKRLYEDKIPNWINDYVQSKGYKIDPKTAMVITSFVGNDLSKLTNELEKIILNLEPDSIINTEHVEKYIGISKEYNVFELQNAIGFKDHERVYRMLNCFIENPKEHHILKYLTSLFNFFVKLIQYHVVKNQDRGEIAKTLGVHPFFLKDYAKASHNYDPVKIKLIIEYLQEYDLKAKGFNSGSTNPQQLFKELVFKILN